MKGWENQAVQRLARMHACELAHHIQGTAYAGASLLPNSVQVREGTAPFNHVHGRLNVIWTTLQREILIIDRNKLWSFE
jgi:hypothetical protein